MGEGFGFAIEGNKFLKIPQVGRVIIHDGVQVGCNVTIDRGSAGDTIIKRNCMIDNLVQIGHNVSIRRKLCNCCYGWNIRKHKNW